MKKYFPCCLLILCLALHACAGTAATRSRSRTQQETTTQAGLRPDPGLVNYLQRQSFLHKAEQSSKNISGTHIDWTLSSKDNSASLIQGGGLWFLANPYHLLHDKPLASLANDEFLSNLQSLGFSGMYVSPLSKQAVASKQYNPMNIQDSLSPSLDILGKEEDLHILREKALQRGLWLGTDALGPSLGFAADVGLAVRSVWPWNSAFIIIEVPKSLWNFLPQEQAKSDEALQVSPIGQKNVSALIAQGLIPQKLVRDNISWLSPTKWYATNTIADVNGKKQRWLLRLQQNYNRALLHLDDSSGTAERILAGSILQNTGERRIALLGINPDLAFGATANEQDPDPLSPGIDYAKEFHKRVSNYSGFSLFNSSVPLHVLAQMQTQGFSMALDSVTSPAAEISLLSGDASYIRNKLQQSIEAGIDHSRLWRPLSKEQGLLFPLVLPSMLPNLRPASWYADTYYDGQRLVATLPALIAMRLKILPKQTNEHEAVAKIARVHKHFFAFLAGLPGIVGLNMHDLQGISHASFSTKNSTVPFAAWSITGQGNAEQLTKFAVPKGKNLYPPLNEQFFSESSFAFFTQNIAKLREEYNIPKGRLSRMLATKDPNIVGYVTQAGKHELHVLMNFSDKLAQFSASQSTSYKDAFTKQDVQGTIQLAPLESRWLLVR